LTNSVLVKDTEIACEKKNCTGNIVYLTKD
ncbi:MAG: hypothetical protein ACI8RD_013784, partial [Bacillariaceae sp.]